MVSVLFGGTGRESKPSAPVVVSSWLPPQVLLVSRSKKHAPGVTLGVGLFVGVPVIVGVDVTVCAWTLAAIV